ncbi:hypothetical protein GW17_00042793 [Ensete ventricosum]|nr:hypothetical protein GW17_00042793 [Ensete ventricosum]
MVALKIKVSLIRSFSHLHTPIDLVVILDMSKGTPSDRGEAHNVEVRNAVSGFLFGPRGPTL